MDSPAVIPPPLRTRREQLDEFIVSNNVACNVRFASCKEVSDRIGSDIQKNTETRKEILQLNRTISNEICRMKNIIERNERKEQYLENKNFFLGDHLKGMRKKEDRLRSLKKELERARDLKSAAPVIDFTEDAHGDINSHLTYLEDYLAKGETVSEDVEMNVQDIKMKFEIIHDVLSSTEKGCKDIAAEETAELDRTEYLTLLPSNDRKETIPSVIKAEDLKEMRHDVEDLITQQKLFATQFCKGKQRLADIWFSEGNELLLGHLREGKLPLYAHTIEHSEVMKLLDPSSTLIFLELGNIRSSLGRVYIHLFPVNDRCQQFLSLCTGGKGPSYANTRLLEVGNGKREYIRCGDYENNNGTGGKTLFPNIFREKESTNPCGCSAGAVLGEVPGQLETGSQFIISTTDIIDSHEKCTFSAFGKVQEGLDVLTHAISQHRNVSDISIKGCGVILSRLKPRSNRNRTISDATSLRHSF